MPLANLLSGSRIAATPVVLVLLALRDWPPSYLIAAVLFVLAQITDILDGYFARRHKTVSNLGIFLDLTADKLMVSSVLIMLVQQNILSGWIAIIIIGREFLITGLRSFAASNGIVIPAGKAGKLKTVFTAIALTWLIVWADGVNPNGILHSFYEWKISDIQPARLFLEIAWLWVYWVTWLTLYSGYIYIRDFLKLQKRRSEPPAGTSGKKTEGIL
jgi:CDP-diacylglycerol--glycerol-3-phosphate 3-phosphatidyltransferase